MAIFFDDKNEDQFGKKIADGTSNELDIASHYPYSPERWRLFVDGSRVFPEHTGTTVSQYNHNEDVHELIPNADEQVVFETAERPRYTVQYELSLSWAFSLNRSLQGNELIRIGYFDGEDGWYLEHKASHDDRTATVNVLRNSVVKKSRKVKLARPVTHFTRLELDTNWYNVGGQIWIHTFTQKNKQLNKELGRTSIDDGTRGPRAGNQPLRFEVHGDSNVGSQLILNAGSVGASTLGNAKSNTRVKSTNFVDTIPNVTDAWVPVRAFRNTSYITNVQLSDLALMDYEGDATISFTAQAFDETELSFSDTDTWSTPPIWNPMNNVIQTRSDINQITDQVGNLQTSTDNPGGYQIGHSLITPLGNNFKSGASNSRLQQKRQVSSRDIIVIMAYTSMPDNDSIYEIVFEEEF